jgi:hypothetical protein
MAMLLLYVYMYRTYFTCFELAHHTVYGMLKSKVRSITQLKTSA